MSRESEEWTDGEGSSAGIWTKNMNRFQSLSTDDSFESVSSEYFHAKKLQKTISWTLQDVQKWVLKIGFSKYFEKFQEQMIDGDMLLMLTESDLKNDIGMESGLHRTRFLRALQCLKMETDYSDWDKTDLNGFLRNLSPELCCYTYNMLKNGIDRVSVKTLTEKILETDCGITNSIHRLKVVQILDSTVKKMDETDNYDVFICYDRGTGSHLASLIKINLSQRGYRVYIDIGKFGKFDSSILQTIQNSAHFLVILTPKCMHSMRENDANLMHRELKWAFENHKNVIPVHVPDFEFPPNGVPTDIRILTELRGIRWIWEYETACINKCIRFITGDLYRDYIIKNYHVNYSPTNPFITLHNHPSHATEKINKLQQELTRTKHELEKTNRKLEEEKKKNMSGRIRRRQMDSSDGSSFEILSQTDD